MMDWRGLHEQGRAALESLRMKESPLPTARPTDVLSEREWGVLTMRINDRMTLKEVAGVLGVTRERVRQVEYKAARKLHEAGLIEREG